MAAKAPPAGTADRPVPDDAPRPAPAADPRHPLFGVGYAPPARPRPLVRLEDGATDAGEATVAEEVPVALVYDGRPHVVMMATPGDLEDLAIGFSLTEGIVSALADVGRISVVRASHAIELQLEIPPHAAALLRDRARSLEARTGCGLCGVRHVEDVLRAPARVPDGFTISVDALWRAGEALAAHQALNRETHAVHAAAWATRDGTLAVVREDVGRHNALDKTLGALIRAGASLHDGFALVTSRASYELVQKCATLGVPLLAAVSRPTGLAIRLAESANVALVGLLRGRSANVYVGAARIRG
jgi:FdhD protein